MAPGRHRLGAAALFRTVMRPLVALTTYPPNEADRYELPAPYIAAVRQAGGRAVLVTPGEDDVADLLATVDALVLTGGGDIDPARYAGPAHRAIERVDTDRDTLELSLAEAVLATSVPTLAICRGMQVVNVAAGGSLHVHLPDVVGDRVAHRSDPPGPVPHVVVVDESSLVADLMQSESVAPMSWHHQAIAVVGDGFRVVATAPDGTIEAIEHESHPWLAAVQWHPEKLASDTSERIFAAFVSAAHR